MRHFRDAVDDATGRGFLWGLGFGLLTGAGIMLTSLLVGGAIR